ncbi:MAG: DUF4492 domain-containing protein [Candidatus Marinimicrobia bacterium]|nr:DUF4492 domain-containing protein [Candidatus Neomarinimicrobiota bacterium]
MIRKIAKFYINGFKNLDKLGIKLWIVILIKLFIIFIILKIFFFQDFLDNKFDNDKDKSDYIIEELT